ncbi:hypothetical protein, partial [Bosea sp. 47.2.35]|uniref:hypothetical protein n=1 Tax=Bosea sp. 47.2.35 TaxID=2969304 RepID=UPI00214F9E8B
STRKGALQSGGNFAGRLTSWCGDALQACLGLTLTGLIELGSYQRDECIGQSVSKRPEPHSLNSQDHSYEGSVAHLDAASVDQVCLI